MAPSVSRSRSCVEVALAVEILLQPPLPGRREIERVHERGEQADIADADVRRRQSEMRGRLQAEREHFGVGGRDIGASERFDAGLQDFARAVAAVAEHRTEIREALRAAGFRRGEIVLRDRNGEIRPQAEIVAGGVGGEIHAGADVLAGQIEERLPPAAGRPASRAHSRRAHRPRPALPRARPMSNLSPQPCS